MCRISTTVRSVELAGNTSIKSITFRTALAISSRCSSILSSTSEIRKTTDTDPSVFVGLVGGVNLNADPVLGARSSLERTRWRSSRIRFFPTAVLYCCRYSLTASRPRVSSVVFLLILTPR